MLPLDDVGSGDVDLIGRLAELVARLEAVTDRLVGTHPLDHWLQAIEDGVGALTSVRPTDSWQLGQVQRELDGLRSGAGVDVDLRLPDVRAMFSDRLAGRPTRANFRTGVLTVSTLVPMRSVPHRVVCLLGLDDGIFPRVGVTDGDDVLARRPLTGERDPRSEDRQLLLDAVLAATDTLVITYTGANEFTGQVRPPAVPVGELLDALDLTATAPDGPVRDRVTVAPPVAAVRPAQPGRRARWCPAGRSRSTGSRSPAPARSSGSATSRRRSSPVRCRRRRPGTSRSTTWSTSSAARSRASSSSGSGSRCRARTSRSTTGSRSPSTPLEEWAVGDRILGDLMRGHHPDAAVERERRRGVVPPGELGRPHRPAGDRPGEPVAREALAHTGTAAAGGRRRRRPRRRPPPPRHRP